MALKEDISLEEIRGPNRSDQRARSDSVTAVPPERGRVSEVS